MSTLFYFSSTTSFCTYLLRFVRLKCHVTETVDNQANLTVFELYQTLVSLVEPKFENETMFTPLKKNNHINLIIV